VIYHKRIPEKLNYQKDKRKEKEVDIYSHKISKKIVLIRKRRK